ncbi:MAG: efflux transporter outer membrane subunit, partial [Opitutales bacterium]
MSKILRPIIFIVLLAFAGCTVGPEYSLPEAATPANFSELTRGFSEPAEHWVKIYNDTELEKLVKKAREHNHDLAALYQRTLQSRAIIRSESAQRRPQLNSGASYERFERTESRRQLIVGENGDGTLNSVRLEESTGKVKSDNYNARLDLGWEIDLFGRVSRLVEAAQLDSDAAEAAYQDLLLITETDVAVAYFRIRSLDRELLAVARSVETRRKSLDIVKKRFNSGAISDLDVAQAETVLAESEAELSFLKRERDILEHALAVLTGQPAPDFSIVSKTLEGTPVAPPLALPSELLQRRPDIRQSELELQTANARIGVATANFYPRISLNANAGYAAMEADKWFSNSAEFFGFGPQVSLPIFQGGRLRAEL